MSPPTITTPKGWRLAALMPPTPIAIGTAPISGKGGHQNRTATNEAGMEDGIMDRFALAHSGVVGKVDHDNAVLHHDSQQHDKPYKSC